MRLFLAMLLALVCALPAAAFAQSTTRRVDIPAGDMVGALDQLARQTGAQFIYDANQLRGVQTAGVHGTLTTNQALERLLQGSGFGVKQDGSGAMVIVKTAAPAVPAAQPSPPPLAPTDQAAANPK
ncbi:MAG TPA: STN domain-containing protein, partial [Rhodanobacteraceae bacterium]|nr:STN domain-containing protein [Rhodanobacteraceae bacterium]